MPEDSQPAYEIALTHFPGTASGGSHPLLMAFRRRLTCCRRTPAGRRITSHTLVT
jgi:hypothetical protein